MPFAPPFQVQHVCGWSLLDLEPQEWNCPIRQYHDISSLGNRYCIQRAHTPDPSASQFYVAADGHRHHAASSCIWFFWLLITPHTVYHFRQNGSGGHHQYSCQKAPHSAWLRWCIVARCMRWSGSYPHHYAIEDILVRPEMYSATMLIHESEVDKITTCKWTKWCLLQNAQVLAISTFIWTLLVRGWHCIKGGADTMQQTWNVRYCRQEHQIKDSIRHQISRF